MKFILITILLFFQFGCAVKKQDVTKKILEYYPSYDKLGYESPKGVFDKKVIKHYAEAGYPITWFLEADFNGDRKIDFAGILRNSGNTLDIVVFYSQDKGYIHQVLYKTDMPDGKELMIGMYLQRPEKVYSFPFDNLSEEEMEANLKYPGIHVLFFETSSACYYWEDNKFKEIWTSD